MITELADSSECVIAITDENKDNLVPIQYPYRAERFGVDGLELPPGFELGMFNFITCDGWFASTIAEDGVPYTNPFPGVPVPRTIEASSYYLNEREERPSPMQFKDGSVRMIAAGNLGFGHSPDHLDSVADIEAWHDRDWAVSRMDRVLAKGRLVEVGRHLVIVGSVARGVTYGELAAMQDAEISKEAYEIRDANGRKRTEVISASFVIQGNARTSLSSTERHSTQSMLFRSANERPAMPEQEDIVAKSNHDDGCTACDQRDAETKAAAEAAEADRKAALETAVADLTAEITAVRQEQEAMARHLMDAQTASA